MRVRVLLGPAGAGKTFRCLTEVRQALSASPDEAPLLLVAPKQTTYQLERQLLAESSLPGYTRLHILSFERLAHFVFSRLGRRAPELLDEEGRLMVLRGLLARKRDDLKLFRASARLTGFAQQLSRVLRELQRSQLTPEILRALANQAQEIESLALKLEDLATLLQDYLGWLKAHDLHDVDSLPTMAAEMLRESLKAEGPQVAVSSDFGLCGSSLWVDGFAEFSEQELDLMAALLPWCEQATMTFCLDRVPSKPGSWLSNWSVVRRTFEDCRKRLGSAAGADVTLEVLERQADRGRFVNSPVLQHLERCWAEPQPYGHGQTSSLEPQAADVAASLRAALCADAEAEVTLAAREILRHVRGGGRYREVTVLVRSFEGYFQAFQRIFARYGIPFFLDRRESVSHHPLAELTRSALRTVALGWQQDDWFAALKTGLVPAEESDVDKLENEALARGWRGAVWQKPLVVPGEPELTSWLADLHQRLLPPFQRLALELGRCRNQPTGPQLASALRELWRALAVEDQLRRWAAAEVSEAQFRVPNSVHTTVWDQMNAWLANVELAFPREPLPVREWLPILEAGLANLTVGVIPPALDQVLIGSIDRSRNPAVELTLVLGLNETVFPASPESTLLLTDTDRVELEKRNVRLGATARQQLGRERYYAYIACTRARRRLVVTSALRDSRGAPLNPSPFLSQILQLFPSLKLEVAPKVPDWRQSEHAMELIGPLLKVQSLKPKARSPKSETSAIGGRLSASEADKSGQRTADYGQLPAGCSSLLEIPALAAVMEQLRHFRNPGLDEGLAPELAGRLYGPCLRTSVSRLEQFAACPFKFFVHSGLRAEERELFELDVREQGTFQHDALALFHEQLTKEGKQWRDITPADARERMSRVARGLVASYRDGLLEASEQTRFMARSLTESLQDFVETLVGWMGRQYRFEPAAVELPFGEDDSAPAWALDLGDGHRLELYGRVDRVDLCRTGAGDEALCVVVDYKSSQKQLDTVLMAHGLQLQLLAYLNVLRRWPNPRALFGVARLAPAGVFYVNLHGKYSPEATRREALADPEQARKLAYRHAGRFDVGALPYLDGRLGARQGDQFNYRLAKDGQIYKGSREAMPAADFVALLDSVETNLRSMGRRVYAGAAEVAPYRKGPATACDQCDYQAICRIDPWMHRYRVLRREEAEGNVMRDA